MADARKNAAAVAPEAPMAAALKGAFETSPLS
jgi:hypothetical protein